MPVRSAGPPHLGHTALGLPSLGPLLGPARTTPSTDAGPVRPAPRTVPPSGSRQPPDGDEFPPRYHDPLGPMCPLLGGSGLESRLEPPSKGSFAPPLPLTSPPGAAPNAAAPGAAPLDSRGWRKDERSERSVRDKIAMFTTAAGVPPASTPVVGHAVVTRRLSNKFKSTEDVFQMDAPDCAPADAKLRSRSVVSVDRVGKSPSSSPSSSSPSSAYSSFCSPESSLSPTLNSAYEAASTLPRKGGAVLARATSFSGQPRAAAPSAAPAAPGQAEEARRASLIALVEQRRRSISKLRGLVIPDKATIPETTSSIPDLPEIRSKDAILIPDALPYCLSSAPPPVAAPVTATPAVLSSPPWKSQGASNLPKYSPAFKRKSLTVRSASLPAKDFVKDFVKDAVKEAAKDSRPTQDLFITESSKSAFLSDRSAEEESDNDSAVSSSRSSISHGFSPPASPLLPSAMGGSGQHSRPSSAGSFLRRTLSSETSVSATSSTASTITSASQASCSSNNSSGRSRSVSNGNSYTLENNRRVLKAQSVDAINRKNVLFSARCRSGRNLKTGSPLMQRKNGEDDGDVSNEETSAIIRRDPREEIKELERMVSMAADTDVESNDALSCDDSVNSSDDTLEPSRNTRIHYRPATLRDLPAADVKVAFLNDSSNIGIELDLHPVRPQQKNISDTNDNNNRALFPKESSGDFLSKVSDDSRKQSSPLNAAPKPLVRKSSIDSNLNGKDTVDNGSRDLASLLSSSERVPILRNLKKRNASDPLFLERNGNVSHSPTALHAVSVHDIRKAFEKAELALSPTSPSPPNGKMPFHANLNGVNERLNGSTSSGSSTTGSGTLVPSHARGSSIDSTTSEDGFPGHLCKEQFGSITSLASTTSLISQQELQQLIDDANQTLEEANNNGSSLPGSSHEVLVVILHRETTGASVGITLAGGADYETKEITVHKILSGSPAERDGRLMKGDRILSINGRNMKGVTHRESLAILKAPRPEVVLVVSRSRGDLARVHEESLSTTSRVSSRPPRILEQPIIDRNDTAIPRGPPTNIVLQKDGAGLGFSLEGGKDSPLGDRPLTIKKIFTGGCAEKSGTLQAGDELLSVNNVDVTKMSRIEAWGLMKRLPNGSVTLTVRHACVNLGVSES